LLVQIRRKTLSPRKPSKRKVQEFEKERTKKGRNPLKKEGTGGRGTGEEQSETNREWGGGEKRLEKVAL